MDSDSDLDLNIDFNTDVDSDSDSRSNFNFCLYYSSTSDSDSSYNYDSKTSDSDSESLNSLYSTYKLTENSGVRELLSKDVSSTFGPGKINFKKDRYKSVDLENGNLSDELSESSESGSSESIDLEKGYDPSEDEDKQESKVRRRRIMKTLP